MWRMSSRYVPVKKVTPLYRTWNNPFAYTKRSPIQFGLLFDSIVEPSYSPTSVLRAVHHSVALTLHQDNCQVWNLWKTEQFGILRRSVIPLFPIFVIFSQPWVRDITMPDLTLLISLYFSCQDKFRHGKLSRLPWRNEGIPFVHS